MRPKERIVTVFIYVLYIALLLPLAYFSLKHPENNFDMLPYMGLVVKMDGTNSIPEIHKKVYEEVEKNVSPQDYQKLLAPGFRAQIASDPANFEKILPSYKVKPLYIWTCYIFYKAGFSLTKSTVMPSIIAFLLIGLLLFYWCRQFLATPTAFFVCLLIMYSFCSVHVCSLSTPDCLSSLFLFICFYFILEKENMLMVLLSLVLANFCRVDNAISIFLIITFLAFNKKQRLLNPKKYLLALFILGAACLIIMLNVVSLSNIFNFYFEFMQRVMQPSHKSGYFSLFFNRFVDGIISSNFIYFLMIALLLIFFPKRSFNNFSFDQLFVGLLVAIIFFRFLLYPDLSDRFYYSFYLVISVLLVKRIAGNPRLVAGGN